MAYLRTELISHTRRVCSLYKRALRNIDASASGIDAYMYYMTLMRQRFEEHRDEKDMRKAKMMLLNGEEELFQCLHFQPKKFANSPGGICYGREVIPPDWVLDFWHPLEKQQYPEYFARREQSKLDYVKFWEKQYGKPNPTTDSH